MHAFSPRRVVYFMSKSPSRTYIAVEVIGFSYSPCGPFPCDSERTCELVGCHPEGSLPEAFEELRTALTAEYGDRISVTLTLLDTGVPDRIKTIIETHYPPIPIILINGALAPVGRISLRHIRKELEALCGD
jgi:hypothetical protein